MTENERAMYTGLSMNRNTEVSLRWSRSQFFLLIHSAGITFAASGTVEPTFLFYIALASIGIVLGVSWLATLWRTDQWIIYWQSRLQAFDQSQMNPVETPLFSGEEYEHVAGFFLTFHRILITIASSFTIAWVVVLVYSFTLP